MVDLTVIGISVSSEGSPVVLLHPEGTERVISLDVGPMEAFAISAALYEDTITGVSGSFTAEETAARFQTHDFMARMTLALGGKLLAVELLRVVDGTFIAEAEVATASEVIRVDCRPSDGIALALRCGAPIRAAVPVLEQGEGMESVLERLPEHVRLLAAAKLPAPRKRGRKKMVTVAAEQDPYREFLMAARKLLEEERSETDEAVSSQESAPATPENLTDRLIDESEFPGRGQSSGKIITGQINIVQAGQTIQLETKPQRLRIALVRKGEDGTETKVLDEFTLPASAEPPKEIIGTLTLTPQKKEEESKKEPTEEERWADLLRSLSPETKLPM